MLRFLANRLASMAVTMFVISILVFFIAEVVPIDPARNALGRYAAEHKGRSCGRRWASTGGGGALRHWITGVVQGDFGQSIHFAGPSPTSLASVSSALSLSRPWVRVHGADRSCPGLSCRRDGREDTGSIHLRDRKPFCLHSAICQRDLPDRDLRHLAAGAPGRQHTKSRCQPFRASQEADSANPGSVI